MNVEQVSDQKTVTVTITPVVASNICSQTRPRPLNIHSTFVLGSPKNTETPVPGWGGETTGPSCDPLRLLSRGRRSKHNTLYRHLEWSYGTTWLFVPPHPSSNLQTIMYEIYLEALSTQALHNLVSVQHTTSFFFVCFRHRPTLSCKHTPSWEKGALV